MDIKLENLGMKIENASQHPLSNTGAVDAPAISTLQGWWEKITPIVVKDAKNDMLASSSI